MKSKLKSIGIVLLFIILFTLIPWVVKFAYFSYVPDSYLFDAVIYVPNNLTTNSTNQQIELERIIGYDFQGNWVDELQLIDLYKNHENRVISYTGVATYTSKEHQKQRYVIDLSDVVPLEPGEYYWSYSIKGKFPSGVERTFTFQSEKFIVKEI